jgi:signal transduction histidine kinase
MLASMSSLVSSARFIIDHPNELDRLGRVLDGIEGRTTHLKHFLNEYAALSRLPRSRPREVPWRPLLARLQQLYPEARIGEPPAESGWFDETQIEQALINLLKNAIEAGGSPRDVELVFRRLDDAIELGVLDRGGGFSAEALQQGLLPFYSTKETGSGVGLALCREVADGHGGSLRIKARDGGGSAVYLVLALKAAPRANRSLALSLTRT